MKIGDKVTFASDLIGIGGWIEAEKGQVATIRDIEYRGGYWSNFFNIYIPKEISGIKLLEKPGVVYRPDTFVELQGGSDD